MWLWSNSYFESWKVLNILAYFQYTWYHDHDQNYDQDPERALNLNHNFMSMFNLLWLKRMTQQLKSNKKPPEATGMVVAFA